LRQKARDVAYQTARTDLLNLVELGLMEKEQVKKKFVLRFVAGLEGLLKEL